MKINGGQLSGVFFSTTKGAFRWERQSTGHFPVKMPEMKWNADKN
jgi:hypothetical protein